MENLCGIDEAGRGPFAGPMYIAGVKFNTNINKIKDFNILTDSKKLSPKKRELLYKLIIKYSSYHIVSVSNTSIDKLGLSLCIKNSIEEIMLNINAKSYLIDGNTTFGIKNLDHKIKADLTIKEVSAASVLAKVSRDRYMVKISKDFPLYGFEQHKGYGTKAHIQAIKDYGFSTLHRLSYHIKASLKTNMFIAFTYFYKCKAMS